MCSIKPVVEGSGSLGELKMKRVHTLKNLLSLIHTMSPLLGECTKSVPLVTDLLRSSVDSGTIPVVKGIKLLGNSSNLFYSVLMSSKVRFESLVLLLHGLQLKDLTFLGKMFQSLESHQLCKKPFLEGFLRGQQSIPSSLNVCNQLALSWEVSGSV